MTTEEIISQILNAWRVHNGINVYLLQQIPKKGFDAIPLASKGRTVAEQFAHMNRVRLGWLHYHRTGKRAKSSDIDKAAPKTPAQFLAAYKKSGLAVEEQIARALRGEAKTRAFGSSAVRWMGYLISHESHHRGSIMLALKQNGMRQPEKIAVQGIWGKWIFGK